MKVFNVDGNAKYKRDINIEYVEFSWDEPQHRHSGIEIVYVVDGVSEHIINENRVRVEKGSFIIMDSDCIHSFENIFPPKYYNILFYPNLISDEINNDLKSLFSFFGENINDKFIHINFCDEENSRIETLFFEIFKEAIQQEKGYLNFIRVRMAELISIVIRMYEKRTKRFDVVDDKFIEAMEYIKKNCCGEVNITDVSSKFGYSSVYFSNMLKKYYGLSFKQLVIKKRLERALFCLWDEDVAVGDIIEKCGFSNRSYFYEVFEKHFGMKPKEIREYWEKHYDIMCEKITSGKI